MDSAVYNQKGEKVSDIKLPETVFGLPWNANLVHQVAVSMMSNRRDPVAHTKGRGDVAGGGKKPWKQKGTGRARAGSNRSPIWRGGGVTFGPTGEQNFSKSIPRKKNRKAILSALATKDVKSVASLKSFQTEKPSTKAATALLKKLGCDRNTLVVIEKNEEAVRKSFANIERVKLIDYRYLNVFDVLKADKIIFIGDSIKKSEELLGVK